MNSMIEMTANLQGKDALRAIEMRIALHIGEARRNMLEVGVCLNEAKDGGLVPHGQWEAWVQANTGLSETKAQRLMKAAREVPSGSTLARLDMSKILTILALPDGEREAMAVRAEEEGLTVRQLREEIEREKRRGDQMMRKYNSIVHTNGELTKEYQGALKEIKSTADDRDAAMKKLRETQDRLKSVKLQLDEACAVLNRRNDGISPKAQEQIDALTAQVDELEAYAAEQARLRQEAQQQLLNMSVGRDEPEKRAFRIEDLDMAVHAFLGAVGVMQYMDTELATLDALDKQRIRRQTNLLEDWVVRVRGQIERQVIEA